MDGRPQFMVDGAMVSANADGANFCGLQGGEQHHMQNASAIMGVQQHAGGAWGPTAPRIDGFGRAGGGSTPVPGGGYGSDQSMAHAAIAWQQSAASHRDGHERPRTTEELAAHDG